MVSKKDFQKINDYLWEIKKEFRSDMRVPARIYISDKLWDLVEEDALRQLINCTTLPGIVNYAIAMPDIHSGYGPPIGGVGAMDAKQGIISPGFVGYDENCGVRLLLSQYRKEDLKDYIEKLATEMQLQVPSGLGRGRKTKLSLAQIDKVLEGGVPYLVAQGYGEEKDVFHCEEQGKMKSADCKAVSLRAKERGRNQLGTLGSGNHFLEIQMVAKIYNEEVAKVFGLFKDQVVVMIHTGSRGLGHQNCADYLKIVMRAMSKYKIRLPDRELACVPFLSPEGQRFFGAMSAACNFAWSNRQMITHFVRQAWKNVLGKNISLNLLYDVAHNIAKLEIHEVNGEQKELIVHRKGATRAFPPRHKELPKTYRQVGQPVLIPGSMGTPSYVLVGTEKSKPAWHTTCHGSGRRMSRKKAIRTISGTEVIKNLKNKGIVIKCWSMKGVAEEAPMAYKNIDEVIEVVHNASLAHTVAQLVPLAVIKGE